MELYCYVPAESSDLELPKGCAILGQRPHADHVTVAIALPHDRQARSNSYADLCRTAYRRFASRQTKRVPLAQLTQVGIWNEQRGEVRPLHGRLQLLERHLGRRVWRNELDASDSAEKARTEGRQQMRRAIMQGRPDVAARLQREHHLPGW